DLRHAARHRRSGQPAHRGQEGERGHLFRLRRTRSLCAARNDRCAEEAARGGQSEIRRGGALSRRRPRLRVSAAPGLQQGRRRAALGTAVVAVPAEARQVVAPALTIRDFASADAEAVNRLAVAAFAPFALHYSDWPAMAANLAKMSALAASGEI